MQPPKLDNPRNAQKLDEEETMSRSQIKFNHPISTIIPLDEETTRIFHQIRRHIYTKNHPLHIIILEFCALYEEDYTARIKVLQERHEKDLKPSINSSYCPPQGRTSSNLVEDPYAEIERMLLGGIAEVKIFLNSVYSAL